MTVAKKEDTLKVEPPKPFTVGYKFLVEATICDMDDSEWPYEVEVVLRDDVGSYESASMNFDKEELATFIGKTNPKFKKDYITQQIKETKALLASLEKQLAAS